MASKALKHIRGETEMIPTGHAWWLILQGQARLGNDDRDCAKLRAIKLKAGTHTITHNGLKVPITIMRDHLLVIHVSKAGGQLRKGTVKGMGSNWTFADRVKISEVIIEPLVGYDALTFHEDNEGFMVVLQYVDGKPQVFKIKVPQIELE